MYHFHTGTGHKPVTIRHIRQFVFCHLFYHDLITRFLFSLCNWSWLCSWEVVNQVYGSSSGGLECAPLPVTISVNPLLNIWKRWRILRVNNWLRCSGSEDYFCFLFCLSRFRGFLGESDLQISYQIIFFFLRHLGMHRILVYGRIKTWN